VNVGSNDNEFPVTLPTTVPATLSATFASGHYGSETGETYFGRATYPSDLIRGVLGIGVSLPPCMLRDTAYVPEMAAPASQDHTHRNVSQNSIAGYPGVFPAFRDEPTAEYDSCADVSFTTAYNELPRHLDPALQSFPANGMVNGDEEVSGGLSNLEYHTPQLAVDMAAWGSRSLAHPPYLSIPSTSVIHTEIWSHGFFPPPPAPSIAITDATNFTIQAGGDDFLIQENGNRNHLNHVETRADNEFWRFNSVAGSFEPSDNSSSDAFLGWRQSTHPHDAI
jgi:hypothetical protein